MSEIPGAGDAVDNEAEALVAKEQWIQSTTQIIVENRILKVGRINPTLALDGVRLAALWSDQFKVLMEAEPPTSEQEIKQRLTDSRANALGLTETDNLYPNGMPMLQVTIAAYDAFCLGFGEEAEKASKLLEWDMQAYGITPTS